MKFLEKYDLDIAVIIGFIISTSILWATVDEAPNDFYIKHLITCVGAYTLTQLFWKVSIYRCLQRVYRLQRGYNRE
jgi:hypothetical protein